MTKPATTQAAPTPVRLPNDLKAILRQEAEANDRSLNGEIVSRLRASLKVKRKPPKGSGTE